MTREEKLYSMRMVDLATVAEKLNVKIDKKGSKAEAIKIILAAEEDMYIAEVMKQKEDLEIECPKIAEAPELVPMPGAEKLAELKEEYCEDGTSYADIGKEIAAQAKEKANNVIDNAVFIKFVKKAQRLITGATHSKDGYHITINVNGKEISYHDKNLQNIRSAIGHIYRGEVEV